MDAVGDAQGLGNLPDSTRMVKVTMSKKDSLYRPTVLLYLLLDTTCLCAWVDKESVARLVVNVEIAVDGEHILDNNPTYHIRQPSGPH